MMKPLFSLITLLIAVAAHPAAASAHFAWQVELRGVRVELKDGRELFGYVAWGDIGLKEGARFPQSLLDPHAFHDFERRKSLTLYTEVYPTAKRISDLYLGSRYLVAVEAETKALAYQQIARIRALPMKYDGYGSEGWPPVYPEAAARMLALEKPHAISGDANEYYISYNRAIGEKELLQIKAETERWMRKQIPAHASDEVVTKQRAKRDRELARKRVVLFIVPGC
jgi:hypothetical protein